MFYCIENSRNGIRSTFTFAIHIISPSFSFWICNDRPTDVDVERRTIRLEPSSFLAEQRTKSGCDENKSQKKLLFIETKSQPCAGSGRLKTSTEPLLPSPGQPIKRSANLDEEPVGAISHCLRARDARWPFVFPFNLLLRSIVAQSGAGKQQPIADRGIIATFRNDGDEFVVRFYARCFYCKILIEWSKKVWQAFSCLLLTSCAVASLCIYWFYGLDVT